MLFRSFFRIGSTLVETQYLNHTAPTLAYRISHGGATLAYVTDHEPFWNSPGVVSTHPGDQRHIAFMKGADVVIHDAQYTPEEYGAKLGWGHSPIDYVVKVAAAANVARLVLFHHDPVHDDDAIRQMERTSRNIASELHSEMDVVAAAEGMVLELAGRSTGENLRNDSALQQRPVAGGRVLLVTDNQSDIDAIEQVLAEDELSVSTALDGSSALERAGRFLPDMIILDATLRDVNGETIIEPMRSLLNRVDLPVIVITSPQGAMEKETTPQLSDVDHLVRPFSPPMLRSRVRAWLARTKIGRAHV